MPADSHDNSSFFRPDPDEHGPGADGSADPFIEDFNAFFEKLSSLDDLQWSSGEAPNGDDGTGTAKAVGENTPPPKRQAAPQTPQGKGGDTRNIAKRAASRYAATKQPRKRPKVEVVSSEDLAASAAASRTRSAGSASPASDDSFDVAKAARILKLALISLILFGLGLGAGWAALSFPDRFDKLIPAVKNGSGVVAPTGTTPEIGMDGTRKTPASGTVTKLGEWIWGNKAANRPAPRTAQELSGSGAQAGGVAADAMDDEVGTDDTVDQTPNPLTEIKPIEVPKVASDATAGAADSSPEPQGAQGDKPVTEPPQVGDFALQVGACSSYRCVESFRQLLLGQVHAGSIKVLSQPGAAGEGGIQRIRIEPLTRVEAERLKAALIADNPQFQGAYLVKER